MTKIIEILKFILWSIFIFILQILVWIIFESFDYNEKELYIFYLSCNFFVFYLLFSVISLKLKVRKIYEILLLSCAQLAMSTFIILSPETLKMRSLDLMFYSIFLFLQPLLFKYNNSIKLITNLTLGIILSLTSLFAYKYISSYILSSFFSEKTNREITSTKQEFYFIDKDSANTTFPFLKKNKIYFIEFWNKSCGICVKNLPEIKRLQSTYKNDTVVEIISLYCPINQNETRDWFYNIFLTNNIKLPDIKYSYTSIGMNLKYKITTFPHFFLIDKEGNGIEGSQVYFDKSLPNNIYDKIEDLKKK